eukprot:CAMPEP_0119336312 /NCGR_PEP_ID=MMETSP1333-20130426/91525_1 /TAXON_ID=418940 /ORGANISM="Scyphosphaera apsteinii, Strain RCC1455" /LENGTH=191 /DNA_ID=CAMNT_0007347083 /DNA_START=127 /DNA_END=702 /DNA_ORIENTATION=-
MEPTHEEALSSQEKTGSASLGSTLAEAGVAVEHPGRIPRTDTFGMELDAAASAAARARSRPAASARSRATLTAASPSSASTGSLPILRRTDTFGMEIGCAASTASRARAQGLEPSGNCKEDSTASASMMKRTDTFGRELAAAASAIASVSARASHKRESPLGGGYNNKGRQPVEQPPLAKRKPSSRLATPN